jgi:hypothetical protein
VKPRPSTYRENALCQKVAQLDDLALLVCSTLSEDAHSSTVEIEVLSRKLLALAPMCFLTPQECRKDVILEAMTTTYEIDALVDRLTRSGVSNENIEALHDLIVEVAKILGGFLRCSI